MVQSLNDPMSGYRKQIMVFNNFENSDLKKCYVFVYLLFVLFIFILGCSGCPGWGSKIPHATGHGQKF